MRQNVVRGDISKSDRTRLSEVGSVIWIDHLLEVCCDSSIENAFVEMTTGLAIAAEMFLRAPASIDPSQMGCFVETRPNRPSLPMLHERTSQFLRDDSAPGLSSCFTSVEGLCSFYGAVFRGLSGADVAGLPSAATLRSYLAPSAIEDARARSPEGAYSGGFMVALDTHGFGDFGRNWIGHIGFARSSFGAMNTANGSAFAAVVKRLEDAQMNDMAASWRRLARSLLLD
jgi:hypothetical protein